MHWQAVAGFVIIVDGELWMAVACVGQNDYSLVAPFLRSNQPSIMHAWLLSL
jgi:hypothetical protein